MAMGAGRDESACINPLQPNIHHHILANKKTGKNGNDINILLIKWERKQEKLKTKINWKHKSGNKKKEKMWHIFSGPCTGRYCKYY